MLDQLEEVDGAVQERRLKLALEIDIAISSMDVLVSVIERGDWVNVRLVLIDIVRQVDQSHNMDGELSKNRSNNVDVEDVGLGAFLGETLDGLRAGDG